MQPKINLCLLTAVAVLAIGNISEKRFSNDVHTAISEINKSQTDAIKAHTEAIKLLTKQNQQLADRIAQLELEKKGENNE